MILPTLENEQKLWTSGIKYVAGVDEVGRGALAGPVVAAAVIFEENCPIIPGIRDSKTLTKTQKNHLNQLICYESFSYGLGEASAHEIDLLGIVPATALAMERALSKLKGVTHILVDGKPFKDQTLLYQFNKTFIVKGDSYSYSIAAASIIAKVYRDTLMKELAQKYPNYGWEKNVGYGTLQHRTSIKQYGVNSLHRLTFL